MSRSSSDEHLMLPPITTIRPHPTHLPSTRPLRGEIEAGAGGLTTPFEAQTRAFFSSRHVPSRSMSTEVVFGAPTDHARPRLAPLSDLKRPTSAMANPAMPSYSSSQTGTFPGIPRSQTPQPYSPGHSPRPSTGDAPRSRPHGFGHSRSNSGTYPPLPPPPNTIGASAAGRHFSSSTTSSSRSPHPGYPLSSSSGRTHSYGAGPTAGARSMSPPPLPGHSTRPSTGILGTGSGAGGMPVLPKPPSVTGSSRTGLSRQIR